MACPEALIDHMLLTNKTFSFPLEERSWREFAYFSANVCHIFGPKNFKDAFSLFERAIVFSQIQSTHHFQKKQEIELDPKGAGQDPELFVTFHYGKYRMLPLLLITSGRSVAVVISEEVYEKYSRFYSGWMQTENGGPRLFLERAENPFLGLRIRGHLERGVDIFVYADGNSGSKGSIVPDGLRDQQLLMGSIGIRSGFMELAHLLSIRTRFVLETSASVDAEPYLQVIERFDPKEFRDRSDFVDTSIRRIYARFSEYLKDSPVNWESLFYLHQSRPILSDKNIWSPEHRVMPLYFPNILDRFSYRVHQVDSQTHFGLCKLLLD